MPHDAWWWLMVTYCDDENDDESDDESGDERWSKMMQDDARWSKMIQDGARWCKMMKKRSSPKFGEKIRKNTEN